MKNFLQVDYFADLPNEVKRDIQRRLQRGNDNDDLIIKASYTTYLIKDYAESFLLDADEVAGLIVYEDGSAKGLKGRQYSGYPSLTEFIEYIRNS